MIFLIVGILKKRFLLIIFKKLKKNVNIEELTEDDVIQILRNCDNCREIVLEFILPKITLDIITSLLTEKFSYGSYIIEPRDFLILQNVKGFDINFLFKFIEIRNDSNICIYVNFPLKGMEDEHYKKLPINFIKYLVIYCNNDINENIDLDFYSQDRF